MHFALCTMQLLSLYSAMQFGGLLSTCYFFMLTPFTADKVEIVSEDSMSVVYLLGNVVITQDSTVITCTEARLNETAGNVVLKDSVKIKDPNGVITSDNALYFFEEKKGFLKGRVVLSTGSEVISSDSLSYDGKKRFVKMTDSVIIKDPKNDMIGYGGEGWYDLAAEKGNLILQPRLEIMRENKNPMEVRAREFYLETKENKFYGYDSVTAIIDSITVVCDTYAYDLKQEKGKMANPVVTEKNNELVGTDGEFALKNKNIEYFQVNKGKADYFTKEGSHNIIEGQSITIFFKDGKAARIVVEGNPKGSLKLKGASADAGD